MAFLHNVYASNDSCHPPEPATGRLRHALGQRAAFPESAAHRGRWHRDGRHGPRVVPVSEAAAIPPSQTLATVHSGDRDRPARRRWLHRDVSGGTARESVRGTAVLRTKRARAATRSLLLSADVRGRSQTTRGLFEDPSRRTNGRRHSSPEGHRHPGDHGPGDHAVRRRRDRGTWRSGQDHSRHGRAAESHAHHGRGFSGEEQPPGPTGDLAEPISPERHHDVQLLPALSAGRTHALWRSTPRGIASVGQGRRRAGGYHGGTGRVTGV